MKRKILIAALLLLPALSGSLFYRYTFIEVLARETRVRIEKGMHLPEIATLLAQKGIIQKPNWFRLYVQLKGKDEALQAGDYRFNYFNSPEQTLEKLMNGKITPLKVRIIEGWTLSQIALYLSKITEVESREDFKEEFLSLAQDSVFIQQLGFVGHSLEGYLFPETYFLPTDATPQDYLVTFTTEFKKKYQELSEKFSSPLNMSQHEIVTFASIVEKETSFSGERPYVASVFYNRLKKGMLLQADPTIIYGLKNFNGNIRKGDIKNPHPYNTYVHPGLPPGPIANPGYSALHAVFNPANTEFIYFVANNSGSHQFSKTLAEHTEAVRQFQAKPKNEEYITK